MLDVRELTTADNEAWDQLVVASPQGNVFQRTAWLAMVQATEPDLRLFRLGCFADQRLVGGQSMFTHRQFGLERSATFDFFYCGPMLTTDCRGSGAHLNARGYATADALANALAARVPCVAMEAHPSLADARPFIYAGWEVSPLYTHIWPLSEPEAVWAAMNREKRRIINQALKRFHFGSAADDATVAHFLALYQQTVLKFCWRPSASWQALFQERFRWMNARDGCRLYTARTADGELVAAVAVLLSREDGTAYLWRQGSAVGYVPAGVVPALYWHVACELAREFAFVNFGGSPQESLSHFKDYLGAQPRLHFRLAKTHSRAQRLLHDAALRGKDVVYNAVMAGRCRAQEFFRKEAPCN
jgi:hypothetical protein